MNDALKAVAEEADPARAARRAALRNGALLVSLILTWAASWPVIKVGVSDIPPVWFGFLRYVIATLCVFALLAVRGGLRLPPLRDWPLVVTSGALQMAAYAALMAYALVTLPPGRASVLAFSTPIWVVPLAAWRLGERISVTAAIGVCAGVCGVATIAAPSLVLDDASQMLANVALMGASLAWAISILVIRAHRFTASPLALAPWQMLVAAAILLPAAIWLEGPLPEIGAAGAASLAFVGPVSTGFAYWAVVEAGRYFQASTMSMALLATPSVGILISALTLGEPVGPSLIAGVLLVSGGIWLATVASTR